MTWVDGDLGRTEFCKSQAKNFCNPRILVLETLTWKLESQVQFLSDQNAFNNFFIQLWRHPSIDKDYLIVSITQIDQSVFLRALAGRCSELNRQQVIDSEDISGDVMDFKAKIRKRRLCAFYK